MKGNDRPRFSDKEVGRALARVLAASPPDKVNTIDNNWIIVPTDGGGIRREPACIIGHLLAELSELDGLTDLYQGAGISSISGDFNLFSPWTTRILLQVQGAADLGVPWADATAEYAMPLLALGEESA